MLARSATLFTLAGFKIKADVSWIFLAVMITWSLATSVFPSSAPGLSEPILWLMGIIGALGLFGSIVLHELSHALVARHYGLSIQEISLFIFGGVAKMETEPPNPKAEFYMAAAGPALSIVLAGIVFLLDRVVLAGIASAPVLAVLGYLWTINLVLTLFNLLPAFPLDGGRVFRAALWKWKGDILWSTRIASYVGSGFGFALMIVGVYFIIRRNAINGIWWILIGFFVRSASQSSYRRLIMLDALKGQKVERFMKTDVVTVSSSIPVSSLVEDYIYAYQFKFFPVVRFGKLEGCVTADSVREVARERWDQTTVGDIMQPCSRRNTIGPEADASEALGLMNGTRASRLAVVHNGELVGIVSLKDMLNFLSLKLEVESRPPDSKSGRS